MQAVIDKFGPLVGRILIAALFVPAGIGKIGGFEGTVGYIASKGLPLPQVGAALAIVVEIGVAAALLLGWRTRWAALILALFTLVSGVIFHNYWAVPPEQQMAQSIHFWKNMAIVGGLLFVAAHGAGAFALDRQRGD
ncbi:DoxX family protein [Caldimonas sp. KR1-144]|uniref:DoxX family protein n=1 Tax=Caldimonas sp. KR1-144 TaxID=3400911 RepID=UPI003BFCC018